MVFRNLFTRVCGIIPSKTLDMRLPNFLSIKKVEKLSRRDEKVFSEASALALLRLEQCIADLRIPTPATSKAIRTGGASAAPGSFLESPDCQFVLTPVLNARPTAVGTEEIINCLRASSGRRMRVTFSDGVVQMVIIGPVDDEGFLHCDPDGADRQAFWTRFKDVDALEAES
jgi:hypothetical protein